MLWNVLKKAVYPALYTVVYLQEYSRAFSEYCAEVNHSEQKRFPEVGAAIGGATTYNMNLILYFDAKAIYMENTRTIINQSVSVNSELLQTKSPDKT